MVADTLATVRRLRATDGDGKGVGAGGFRVLRASQRVRGDPRRRRRVGHRAPGPESQGRHRRDRRRCLDTHRIHRRRLRRDHRHMDLAGRGRRDRVHRVQLPRRPASRFAGRLVVRRIPDLNHRSDTGRPPCSTPGASTRSSPPPTSTPSPPTRPTAATRSSNRSTPTSKTPPWPIYPRDDSPPTPPGWCWRSSRSTSPAPRPPSPAPRWPRPAPPPSAAPWSRCPARIASSAPPPDPAPTARLAMGNRVEHAVRQPVSPTSPDHRLTRAPHRPLDTKDPAGTTRHRGRAITHAHTTPHPDFKAHNRNQHHTDSRWRYSLQDAAAASASGTTGAVDGSACTSRSLRASHSVSAHTTWAGSRRQYSGCARR